jgi:hypothetical protein
LWPTPPMGCSLQGRSIWRVSAATAKRRGMPSFGARRDLRSSRCPVVRTCAGASGHGSWPARRAASLVGGNCSRHSGDTCRPCIQQCARPLGRSWPDCLDDPDVLGSRTRSLHRASSTRTFGCLRRSRPWARCGGMVGPRRLRAAPAEQIALSGYARRLTEARRRQIRRATCWRRPRRAPASAG